MKKIDLVLKLAEENNGMVTSEQVSYYDVQNAIMSYLVAQGKLERVGNGVFVLPESFEDEYLTLQYENKKGIYSHITALYLYELTDINPSKLDMTFPRGYNAKHLKEKYVQPHYEVEDIYYEDIKEIIDKMGNKVKCYSMEKTICDLARNNFKYGRDVFIDAIKRYLKRADKNIEKLLAVSKKTKVEKTIETYLEVLAS